MTLPLLWHDSFTHEVEMQRASDSIPIAWPPHARFTAHCVQLQLEAQTRAFVPNSEARAPNLNCKCNVLSSGFRNIVFATLFKNPYAALMYIRDARRRLHGIRAALKLKGLQHTAFFHQKDAIETQRLAVHSCHKGVLEQVKLKGLTQIAIYKRYQPHSRSTDQRSLLSSNNSLSKVWLHILSMHSRPHVCPPVAS